MYHDPRWAAGHGLARLAARLPGLAPPATRPLVWERLGAIAWTAPAGLADLVGAIYDDHERELPDADLACLGLDLIERTRAPGDRIRGCVWLTLYPSALAATALAAILRDPSEPPALRDQAAWTLGFRQRQERSPTLRWPAEAIAIADDALADALCGADDLPQLAMACRHVASPAFHERIADLPLPRVREALEGFASPRLAARLLDEAATLEPRLIALAAHVLGGDAVARLIEYAADAPLAHRCEAIFGALAFAPELAAADALLAENPMMPQLAARAAWQRAHPGEVPLPRACAIARTTATLAEPRAHEACAYFAQLDNPPLALWRHCAYLAGGDAAIACPDHTGFLAAPYLDALARAGRFHQLAREAAELRAPALATWLLARGGRPFLALALARQARADDLDALAGQALALFAAGRPDLAMRSLAIAPARLEPADAAWRAPRDPRLAAYLGQDLLALASLAVPAPAGADPDRVDLTPIAALERALSADLAGASVHLAGNFSDRNALLREIERRGGLVVSGPFGKVDYVLVGDDIDPEELARLTSLGATPLSPAHLR